MEKKKLFRFRGPVLERRKNGWARAGKDPGRTSYRDVPIFERIVFKVPNGMYCLRIIKKKKEAGSPREKGAVLWLFLALGDSQPDSCCTEDMSPQGRGHPSTQLGKKEEDRQNTAQ